MITFAINSVGPPAISRASTVKKKPTF